MLVVHLEALSQRTLSLHPLRLALLLLAPRGLCICFEYLHQLPHGCRHLQRLWDSTFQRCLQFFAAISSESMLVMVGILRYLCLKNTVCPMRLLRIAFINSL